MNGFRASFNTEVGHVSPVTSILKDTEKVMIFWILCSLLALPQGWEMRQKTGIDFDETYEECQADLSADA